MHVSSRESQRGEEEEEEVWSLTNAELSIIQWLLVTNNISETTH